MFDFMNSNMNFFHGTGMILFWTIVVFIIITLFSGKQDDSKNDKSALDILKRRLAKGEISIGEYEKLKDKIE